ncbi:MAG: tetrahydromethanopterin S-methyltransferase subunit H [Candidatus Bathyarchaeia archaeon]
MFRFEKEQKVINIGGVKVGGQPGEFPTVLIGSIFYEKHKIVSNPDKGIFDKAKAEGLIKKMEEFSDKTGNPFFLDVVGRTSEALINEIDFVADITQAPFLVDGASEKIRLPAAKHAFEIGLKDRVIYNSIDYATQSSEIQAMKELGVKSSIVLAFNKRNPWPEGAIEILEGKANQKGLLNLANEAGIENILVDTAVADIVTIGLSAKALNLVKNKFGLPAGCGPANAYTSWTRGKKGEFGPLAYNVVVGSAGTFTQLMGANFIMFGPVELAETVFPACAMADALIAYASKRVGTKIGTNNHPLFKII